MSSILSGFDIVQQALAAQQFALSITQKNVANADDPSYTREQVVTGTGAETEDSVPIMPGVSLQASRDRYIDYSISQELQTQAQHSTESDALEQIDAVVNQTDTQGLQQALSNFFNSFTALSSTPEDLTLRQQVLSSANALTDEFHQLYDGIQQVQTSEDSAVKDTVGQVNSLTAQIAALNSQVESAQGAQSEDVFTLRDNRQQLVEQLSGLVGLSYYETESGAITVTTKQGGLLVAGNQSYALTLTPSPSGAFQDVSLNGTDITATLTSGQLGGLIDMRDNKIAGYLSTLDNMAATVISAVNAQHAQGVDLNGAAGGDFFTPFTQPSPGSNAGAARSISVALTDPALIAAAGPGTGVGDNTNATLLAGIGSAKLFSSSSETVSQYYGDLVYQIGSDEQSAQEDLTTDTSVLSQLQNQRDSDSGVDLNDEAVNLVQYQRAYQASAQFASVLDTLSDDILQIFGTTTS